MPSQGLTSGMLNSANNNNNNNNGSLTPNPATALSQTSSVPNSMLGGLNYGENYDFFDPQNWMLDGLLDFNYSYVPPLEGA